MRSSLSVPAINALDNQQEENFNADIGFRRSDIDDRGGVRAATGNGSLQSSMVRLL